MTDNEKPPIYGVYGTTVQSDSSEETELVRLFYSREEAEAYAKELRDFEARSRAKYAEAIATLPPGEFWEVSAADIMPEDEYEMVVNGPWDAEVRPFKVY